MSIFKRSTAPAPVVAPVEVEAPTVPLGPLAAKRDELARARAVGAALGQRLVEVEQRIEAIGGAVDLVTADDVDAALAGEAERRVQASVLADTRKQLWRHQEWNKREVIELEQAV